MKIPFSVTFKVLLVTVPLIISVAGTFTFPLNVSPLSFLSTDKLKVLVSLVKISKLVMAFLSLSPKASISSSVLSMSMKQNLLSLYWAPSTWLDLAPIAKIICGLLSSSAFLYLNTVGSAYSEKSCLTSSLDKPFSLYLISLVM